MEMKSSKPEVFSLLKDKLKGLIGQEGKVGWFETAKYENGTSVAYVAAIQEFGNSVGVPIPPRPFMRPAVIENENKWADIAAKGAKKMLAGEISAENVMERIVISAHNSVSKNIATVTAPPLSPITLGARKYRQQGKKVTGATIGEIARKLREGTLDISGVSTKPLEDTGLMSSTLTSTVNASVVKEGK